MTFDLTHNQYFKIDCGIGHRRQTYHFLVDTQADVCIIRKSSLSDLMNINVSRRINIRGITLDAIKSLGTIDIDLYVDQNVITHEFNVVPDQFNIECDGIIGKDFLSDYQCVIDYSDMSFRVRTIRSFSILKLTNSPDGDHLIIPPRCESIRQFVIDTNEECVVDHLALAPGVYTARTIVNPKQAFIRVINTTNEIQRISNKINQFELLSDFDCCTTNEVTNTQSERSQKLNSIILNNVPLQYRDGLSELVDEFTDIFALPEDEMTVNNFYSQRLRTVDDSPTYIRNYRTPHTVKSEIHKGSFRWKVLPFGLNVSPNSFMRMMNLAFSGLHAEKIFIYMDDIIVLGKSESDHLYNLKQTFLRCRQRNLKVNPNKCKFFRTEVLFLGHQCSSEGIKPDSSKFKAISEFPAPTNADAVRRFVALANYYRKILPNFATISIPLNNLTRKNAIFTWDKKENDAFISIKNMLLNPRLLAYPDYNLPFTLTVDASKSGCGAVLSQESGPIAFASKTFNRAK